MTKPISIIEIQVTGPVGSGKSAVLASIRDMLEGHGFCVAIPNREERYNASRPLTEAKHWERPSLDQSVVVLTERCITTKSSGAQR